MAADKEIRGKIKSVENTRKITKAMEMVAASKMRKAQERMRSARPYSTIIRNIAGNMADANPEYRHPFLIKRDELKKVGLIVVTTDKGLCGAMNTNVLRAVTHKLRELEADGVASEWSRDRQQGPGLPEPHRRQGGVARDPARRHAPSRKLIGPVKVLLDAYQNGDLDAVYVFYTKFINTMGQEPVMEQLVPLAPEKSRPTRDA